MAAAIFFLAMSSVPQSQPLEDVLQGQRKIPRTLRFEHLSIEDGLPQNAVISILQDSLGYLWTGSEAGLTRYDGYSFVTFSFDPDDPHSLSNNGVGAIVEDKNGALWVGTWGGGLNYYDPLSGTFTRYQHDDANPDSLTDDFIISMVKDTDGALWIGTFSGGLDHFDPQSGIFTHYRHIPGDSASLASDNVSTLFLDSQGRLWVGSGFNVEGAGISVLDASRQSFARYTYQPQNPRSLSSNNIGAILEDTAGRLWIGTGNYGSLGGGLNLFDPQSGTFNRFVHDPSNPNSLAKNEVVALYEDEQGILWIGTWGGGLDLFDPDAPQVVFHHFRHDPFDESSLSMDVVWNIYQDQSGMVWLGTTMGGLNIYDPQKARFSLYRRNPSDPASLGNNSIGGFYEDSQGRMWVATWGGGLNLFDRETDTFTQFTPDPERPDSLISASVNALLEDSQGNFWVGTFGGLELMDVENGTFTHFLSDPNDPATLSDNSVTFLLEDSQQRLWVGTFGGLNLYDRATGAFTRFLSDSQNPASLADNRVMAALEGRDGILWFGTWGGGLHSMNPQMPGVFTHYLHDPSNPESISDNSVWGLVEDEVGNLWVATMGGLNYYDRQANTFTRYHKKDGLPSEVILCLVADQTGNLWGNTDHGLFRFYVDTGKIDVFTAEQGLQSNEFNSGACYRDRQGLIYVGGIQGFNVFDPAEIVDNPVPPPVVINRFSIFNEPQPVDLSGNTRLQLQYWQNFIAFEFAALDFHASGKNQYAYMLEGFDKEWIYSGARRYASYTNLPGGDYVFRVKAANSDGVWNEAGAAIPITVVPPYWQTWWFRGVIALLVIGFLAAGYTLRLRTIHEQKSKLEAEVALRTAELRQAQEELARRAESALQQSDARFKTVFEHTGMGIAIRGMDGVLMEANPSFCRMMQRDLNELRQLPFENLIYPGDVSVGQLEYQELLKGQRSHYQVERRYQRKDGSIFWGRATISLVCDANGNPQFSVGMLEDIDLQKKTLAELQASEIRFRAIFDNAAVGICLMNRERQYLAFNPAVLRMNGYSAEEYMHMRGSDITYPADADVGSQEFQEILEGKRESFQIEKRYIRKNGSVFWARVTVSAVRDSTGELMYLVVLTEDIDAQKLAQDELRQSEARFRAMFDHAGVGISLIGMDRSIKAVNPAILTMSGYTLEEMLAIKGGDLTYEEDVDLGREEFLEIMQGKRDSLKLERRYVRKTGETFWVRVTASAVRDEHGKPLYLVVLTEDIDTQRKAQEELRLSEARFRAMFDNVTVGMALLTIDRKVISANQAAERLLGYTAEELKQMDISDLPHPEDKLLGREQYLAMMEGKSRGFQQEMRMIRKDGSMFWARVTNSVVIDEACCPNFLIILLEDITEAREAREMLEKQEKEYLMQLEKRVEERTQDLESANLRLTQEMQQRIRAEEALASKAAEEAVSAERTRLARDLHDAVTQTLFSASLIAEVLPDLWKMDEQEALKSTEELRQLTRGALAEMRTLLLELRPAALTQSRLEDLLKQLTEALIGRARLPVTLTVRGERKLAPEVQVALYRIAQESLNNVVKYARPSQVNVNLSLYPEGARLEIIDDGIGFDVNRVKPTSLGLRIMRERVEAIGADLKISSKPGGGTCVCVTWMDKSKQEMVYD